MGDDQGRHPRRGDDQRSGDMADADTANGESDPELDDRERAHPAPDAQRTADGPSEGTTDRPS